MRGSALGLTVLILRSGLWGANLHLAYGFGFFSHPCGPLGVEGRARRATDRGPSLRCLAAASSGNGKPVTLDRMLQQQGFGTRKFCRALVKEVGVRGRVQGRVEVCMNSGISGFRGGGEYCERVRENVQ